MNLKSYIWIVRQVIQHMSNITLVFHRVSFNGHGWATGIGTGSWTLENTEQSIEIRMGLVMANKQK